jgi:phage terminase large subunit
MADLKLSQIVGKGYRDFWHSKARYRVIKGGRASKKSTTAALWFIVHLMANPNANLLVVRRYGRTLKDSCFAQLRWAIERLGVSEYWHATLNPMEIIFTPTGQRILFRGLDDGIKVTSITVAKGVLCWVWIDEAYEIREDDFNKLDMSIRGRMPDGLRPQLVLTFNPWSEHSFLKRRFFDVTSPNIFTQTTTYQCNEWLSDDDIAIFKEMAETNPRRFDIEGLGNWGVSEGLIYNRFHQEEFDYKDILKDNGRFVTYGLDFGFTDPTAFCGLIVDQKLKKIWVFSEWYARGVTNEDIAKTIKQRGLMREKVYCDAAEPKSIAELKKLGVNAVPASKGADSVRAGIQKLQSYEWIISPECPNFHHEIMNYLWKKDRNGNTTDEPEHEFSHLMDSARYALSELRQPLQIHPNNLMALHRPRR